MEGCLDLFVHFGQDEYKTLEIGRRTMCIAVCLTSINSLRVGEAGTPDTFAPYPRRLQREAKCEAAMALPPLLVLVLCCFQKEEPRI